MYNFYDENYEMIKTGMNNTYQRTFDLKISKAIKRVFVKLTTDES